MKFLDGSTYKGDFKNNEFNGRGVLKTLNGYVYDGEFLDGNKHGKNCD